MDHTVTSCRRGGFNIVVDADYEDLLEAVREDIEIASETPHLTVARFDGEKLSIKPGKIVLKVEDRDRAEAIAASLLE